MRLLFILLLCPVLGVSQELPQFLENYFHASPVDRIIQLDTSIRVSKNSFRSEFIAYDLAALTGDTITIKNLYTRTGHLNDQIVDRNDRLLKKVFKRWRKYFKRNKINKQKAVLDSIDYYGALSAQDTLIYFLYSYVKMPVLSRIDYFESHYQQTSVAQKMELDIIVADLNSITGCHCSPYVKSNGMEVMNALEADGCITEWKMLVDRKK